MTLHDLIVALLELPENFGDAEVEIETTGGDFNLGACVSVRSGTTQWPCRRKRVLLATEVGSELHEDCRPRRLQ